MNKGMPNLRPADGHMAQDRELSTSQQPLGETDAVAKCNIGQKRGAASNDRL